MAEKLIALSRELNPEFYRIMDNSIKIMDDWNRINDSLHMIRIPKLRMNKTKKKLKLIAKSINELQKNYIKWNSEARDFHINPLFNIENNLPQELVFLHNCNILRDQINRLNFDMKMLVENFLVAWRQMEGQRNFNIAISSFTFSIISLVYTILFAF
ncbi:MAG: hypothetical protein JW763_07345 [candidate division Zixibacteria bacterium]|nr:hypothetical protein [candidate division Zixibacteria bacterium]